MFDNFWARLWKVLSENYTSLADGLKYTVIIAFCGFALGLFFATIISVITTPQSQNPKRAQKIINKIFAVYTWIFRGIPMVVLLLLLYFVFLPELRLDALIVAIIAFGLYGSAYLTEILRAGIHSIDKGQYEACRASGLGHWCTMRKVILPQAYKNSIPSIGNILIEMVKETAVVSFITVIDLTKTVQFIITRTYDAIVPYILLAVIYLIIVGLLTLLIKFIEKVVFRYGK